MSTVMCTEEIGREEIVPGGDALVIASSVAKFGPLLLVTYSQLQKRIVITIHQTMNKVQKLLFAARFVQKVRGSSIHVYLVDHDNYVYRRHRITQGRISWRCIWSHKFRCPGRVVTANNSIVKHCKLHNHISNLSGDMIPCPQPSDLILEPQIELAE